MAYKYETDCKKFLDPDGHIKQCKKNQDLIDEIRDQWDKYYGIPPYSYEVYVLTDSTIPIKMKIDHMAFDCQPFYVGHGLADHRVNESKALGRQKDRIYTKKVQRIEKIINEKGGVIRAIRIGQFYTKEKATVVEKKVIKAIDDIYPGILENAVYNNCKLPLYKEDCNVICNGGILCM